MARPGHSRRAACLSGTARLQTVRPNAVKSSAGYTWRRLSNIPEEPSIRGKSILYILLISTTKENEKTIRNSHHNGGHVVGCICRQRDSHNTRKQGRTEDTQRNIRPVCRAPRVMYLRRTLGRGKLSDTECQRLPQGCFRCLEGTADSRAALAGRMLRRRIPLDGRHRSEREAAEDAEQQLGWNHRGQLLRYTRVPKPLRDAWLRALHKRQRGKRHRRRAGQVGGVYDQRRRYADGKAAPRERPRQGMENQVPRRGQRELGMRRQHAPRILCRPLPPLLRLLPRI